MLAVTLMLNNAQVVMAVVVFCFIAIILMRLSRREVGRSLKASGFLVASALVPLGGAVFIGSHSPNRSSDAFLLIVLDLLAATLLLAGASSFLFWTGRVLYEAMRTRSARKL